MKHVNKWPLALYVCMNSIFKCFIGNRIEWSHIEWHYFSNWQVLLIQTSPCYCLLGSIYSPVKMFTGVGKGTLAFLIDPELLGIRDLSPLHPLPSIPPHPWGGRIQRTFGVREEDYARGSWWVRDWPLFFLLMRPWGMSLMTAFDSLMTVWTPGFVLGTWRCRWDLLGQRSSEPFSFLGSSYREET